MRKFTRLVCAVCLPMFIVFLALGATPATLRKGGPYSPHEYVIDEACLHLRGCFLPRPDGRGIYLVERGRVFVGRSSFPVRPGMSLIWARTKPWMMYTYCLGASGPCSVYVDRRIGPSINKDDLSRDLVARFAAQHKNLRCASDANVAGVAFLDHDSKVLVIVEYPRGGGCNSDPSLVSGFLVAVPSMEIQEQLDAKELLVRFKPHLSEMIRGEIREELEARRSGHSGVELK